MLRPKALFVWLSQPPSDHKTETNARENFEGFLIRIEKLPGKPLFILQTADNFLIFSKLDS